MRFCSPRAAAKTARRRCEACRAPRPAAVSPHPAAGPSTDARRACWQLRTLIAAQEQWKSSDEREAMAARAAAAGEKDLAVALRRRDTSLLRKRHLLYLAHAWSLRSNLWRRKVQATPAAPAAAPPQPAAASPMREASLTHELQLQTYAADGISRLRAHAATLTSGAEARRAITSTRAYGLVTPFAVAEWRGVLHVNSQLLAAAGAALAGITALRSRADSGALDGEASVWQAMHGDLTPAEELLERVRSMYAVGSRLIQTRSAARWRDRQPTAVERVYFDEPLESARASLEQVARGSATLAQLRLGPVRNYLAGAEAVATAVSESLHAQDRAARERLGWLTDFVDRRNAGGADVAVVPTNFPVLEAEAASAMPMNWEGLAADVSKAGPPADR